jgi:hypothetical protein
LPKNYNTLTGQFPYLSAATQIIKNMHSYTSPFLARIRELVAADQLDEATRQLRQLLQNSPLLDEAVQQSARYNDVMRQIRLGVVSFEDANVVKNQVRAATLELLREIEKQAKATPPIQAEIEKHEKGITIIQQAEKIYNINHIDNANFY